MQESELILDYDDWSIYYKYGGDFIYVDKDTKEIKQVELIGTLHYNVINEPLWSVNLDTLFDNFCCGEQVNDDEIIYWWFKEKE